MNTSDYAKELKRMGKESFLEYYSYEDYAMAKNWLEKYGTSAPLSLSRKIKIRDRRQDVVVHFIARNGNVFKNKFKSRETAKKAIKAWRNKGGKIKSVSSHY